VSEARVRTKLCGITSVRDAELCVALGADSIGLNFVAGTRRCIDRDLARAIAAAVGDRVLVVGVVADMERVALAELKDDVGLACLQLHGSEAPADLEPFLPHAYKAVALRSEADLERARSYGGRFLLVDAPPNAAGELGGTGSAWGYALAAPLARERRLSLAGGLHAGNVAEAIAAVRPWCVDVASGIEEPGARRGEKSEARVAAFLEAVRGATA
jgi:phosphoribosylanthranilate isomerase